MPKYELNFVNTVSLPEFQEWTDKYGMMDDNDRGDSSGNGILFTAHYTYGLKGNNILGFLERQRINEVVINNFREPGLLNRIPGNNDWRQAHDDIVGLMAIDALVNPEERTLTNMLYEHGKVPVDGIDSSEKDPDVILENKRAYFALKLLTFNRIKYVWNNVQPHKFHVSSWLARRAEIVAPMQMARKKCVNPLYWTYWAIIMLKLYYYPGDKTNRDSYILRFHSALAVEGYGRITNWVCKKVREAVKRDYGDFGQLIGAYFQKPWHPIVKLCKGL